MEHHSACIAPATPSSRPAGEKLISVVSACYNEEENVRECYEQVKKVMLEIGRYRYEHLFIDNASKDGTLAILRELAAKDKNVKVIANARNFGHIRSPYHGMLSARGDAVISVVSDLQDPPELIKEFLKKWEEGFFVVMAVKADSDESPLFFAIRKAYYELVSRLAEVELVKNTTGFGLYDRRFIEIVREIDDPYPYFRGLVSDIGFPIAKISYHQPVRRRGITSNNFYSLYDMAMLGITNHSKVPLRLATMLGFAVSFLSLLVALGYFVWKLLYWNSFTLGLAPLEVGLFFFGSVQLFFIGIVGEYIGSIHTQVQKRPPVVERERINFEPETVKGFSPVVMKVVILCGGLGTRLREETEFRPKPMVPIGNRPILWHIMKFYASFGFKEFILCLGYKSEVIKEYFFHYQWHCSDMTLRLGPTPQITFHNQHPEEDWQVTLLDTGLATQTGGRVRRALAHIPDDEFLLTYGDGLCNVPVPELIKFHRARKGLATLTAVRPGGRFGELSLSGDAITSFREKPDSEAGYINGGFFVLNKKIGEYLAGDSTIFEFDALPKLAEAGKLNAFRHDDFWQCMDNPREMEMLNKLWNDGNAPWKLW